MKGKNNLEIAKKKITFLNIIDLVNYTQKKERGPKGFKILEKYHLRASF